MGEEAVSGWRLVAHWFERTWEGASESEDEFEFEFEDDWGARMIGEGGNEI
jgi:hypothetical protein